MVKDLYLEKGIDEISSKQTHVNGKDIPCSRIRRISGVKASTLPKSNL